MWMEADGRMINMNNITHFSKLDDRTTTVFFTGGSAITVQYPYGKLCEVVQAYAPLGTIRDLLETVIGENDGKSYLRVRSGSRQ